MRKRSHFALYNQQTSMETNPFLKAALQPRQRRLEIGGDPKLGGKHIQLAKNATRFTRFTSQPHHTPRGIKDLCKVGLRCGKHSILAS